MNVRSGVNSGATPEKAISIDVNLQWQSKQAVTVIPLVFQPEFEFCYGECSRQ